MDSPPSVFSITEISDFMIKNNWIADYSPSGLWAIGPEDKDGTVKVLAMAPSFMDAFLKAKRSLE